MPVAIHVPRGFLHYKEGSGSSILQKRGLRGVITIRMLLHIMCRWKRSSVIFTTGISKIFFTVIAKTRCDPGWRQEMLDVMRYPGRLPTTQDGDSSQRSRTAARCVEDPDVQVRKTHKMIRLGLSDCVDSEAVPSSSTRGVSASIDFRLYDVTQNAPLRTVSASLSMVNTDRRWHFDSVHD